MENLELLRMTPAEFDTYYAQAVEIYAAELEKSRGFPDSGEALETICAEVREFTEHGDIPVELDRAWEHSKANVLIWAGCARRTSTGVFGITMGCGLGG